MRDIAYDERLGLTVGAAVTMNDLAGHPDVQAHYPVLAEAARAVASYQIRNRATLGGNLCNASPCADSAPAMLVLEAEFVLYGPDGYRSVPADEFFLGPGQTALDACELMTGVRVPPGPLHAVGHYQKLGRCRSGDLALVGVAILGYGDGTVLDPAAGPGPPTTSEYRFRIGLGSVAPTPLRAREAEELLASQPPGEETFVLAAERAMAVASPITDVRGTATYQRAMVRTLALRSLREVWARLQGASEGEDTHDDA
jgi:carbon-monoxide dehydrogenase medium subunit